LEKQRSRSFGLDLDGISSKINEDRDECDHRTTMDAVSNFSPLQMLLVVL